MIFVIGPPDSGKSRIAEDLAQRFTDRRLYYIATMKVMDEEGEKRVERHKKMRSGKGFTTLELTRGIARALSYIEDPGDTVAVLECVANLVGNEMYDDPEMARLARSGPEGVKEFSKAVVREIEELANGVSELIVVSSRYESAPADDEETVLYKKLLNVVNIILKDRAGDVYDTAGHTGGKG